jgi:hypothetical protein
MSLPLLAGAFLLLEPGVSQQPGFGCSTDRSKPRWNSGRLSYVLAPETRRQPAVSNTFILRNWLLFGTGLGVYGAIAIFVRTDGNLLRSLAGIASPHVGR